MFSLLAEHFTKEEIAVDLIFLASLILVWLAPGLGKQIFDPIEKSASRLAARKVLAMLLIVVVPILMRFSLIGVLPVPVPGIHDEFSYLLAADTFAHCRLTNPTHPMWVFFDTIHVNQHPTYMSKYPPAQGAVLGLGQLLGQPWIGVLLSVATMCAAILWMLRGWLPPRWALLGATLVLLRLAIFSYWTNSYWGGAIPAIGGALVLGATPRLVRFWRRPDALLLGIGAVLLANSRPLEGLILCLPVFVYLVVQLSSKIRHEKTTRPLRILLPMCAVVLPCLIFMGYYNWRGTGSPFVFPYMVNEKTYVTTPTLFWEEARPPLRYSNPQFEAYYNGWMHAQWIEGRVDGITQAVKHIGLSGTKTAYFFLWPELCLPLVALPWIFRDSGTRFLIIVIGVSFLGFLLVPWTQAHYAAPLTGVLFALVVQGIRHLRQCKHGGRPVGIGFSRVIVLFAVLLAPIHPHSQAIGNLAPAGIEYRAEFERQLAGLPGQHLVIVRYLPNHPVLQEWVYNRADIDGSKIVWAREIPGMDQNPLLNYFKDRRVWLAEPDLPVPRLSAYSGSQP
jgi:hypothetical protein